MTGLHASTRPTAAQKRRKAFALGQRRLAVIRIDGRNITLGHWATRREMEIARDRAVMHLGLDRELWLPGPSRKLGPASPEELRRLAHLARKAAERSSEYSGVTYVVRKDRWHAGFQRIFIGAFLTEIEAAEAVDRYARHIGEPPPNFPERDLPAASVLDLRRERRARKPVVKSRYAGVDFTPELRLARPWIFRLNVDGESMLVGGYETEVEAAVARDRALFHYGIDLPLSFPKKAKRLGPADIETLRREVHVVFKTQTTSQYRGVSVNARNGRFIAEIKHEAVRHFLGEFDDEVEAAVAYDDAALRFRGADAWTNFGGPT